MSDVPPNIFHSTQQRFHRAVDPRYNVKAGVTVLHPTPDQQRRQSYIGQIVNSYRSGPNMEPAFLDPHRVVEGHYDFEEDRWKYTLVSTSQHGADGDEVWVLPEDDLIRLMSHTSEVVDDFVGTVESP